MALVDPEALRDPTSVALAATLRLAQRIEALLTEAGVDYVVQVEMYGRSFLFGTPRHGAVFYVAASQAAFCRERLCRAGLAKTVIEPQPGTG